MKSIKKCFLTGFDAEVFTDMHTDEIQVISPACGGKYILSESAHYLITHDTAINIYINQQTVNCARRCLEIKKQNPKAIPVWITRDEEIQYTKSIADRNLSNRIMLIPCILEDSMEELVDHSDKPIELLKSFSKKLAKEKAFASFEATPTDLAWARIVDEAEYSEHLSYLTNKGLLKESGLNSIMSTIFENKLKFTIDGWAELISETKLEASRKVFIATAFRWPEEDDIRVRALEAIKIACKELGYDADIVSQGHTNNISNQILAEIRQSKFIIAELTYHNRGVYFESGFARGLNKDVFHVVRKGFTSHKPEDDFTGRRIHFDVAQIQYREWENPEDLKSQLKVWIEATIGRYS